jgi:hypothetical protein
VSKAAWRQLQPLRYSDACPCGHDILDIAHCDLLDSDARHSGLCVSSSLSEATAWNSATFGTRMHAPAATTSSAQYLTTRSTRMHAPATSAALAAGHQLQSPRRSGVLPHSMHMRPRHPQRRPCKPSDSDTRPGGHCVDGSMATASISAIPGCTPLQPLHPRHSTLQPAGLGTQAPAASAAPAAEQQLGTL